MNSFNSLANAYRPAGGRRGASSTTTEHRLRNLGAAEQQHAAGEVIEAEDARRPRLRILLSGWACACRTLPDGRRQILRLILPGDLCSVFALDARPDAGAAVALTRARTADLGPVHVLLDPSCPQQPAVAATLRTVAAREYAGLLTHLVRLGRMSAYERTGHLLLELFERQQRAGLVQGRSMPLPLTQEVLADVLGLSIVHVNRTLQQLRREGLIVYRAGRVTFSDMERLADLCGYTLEEAPAAAPVRAAAPRAFSPMAGAA